MVPSMFFFWAFGRTIILGPICFGAFEQVASFYIYDISKHFTFILVVLLVFSLFVLGT